MGFRGKYKNKRDANEPQIIASLEAHGFTVERMDTPVDLLCGYANRSYLVEVKMPGAGFTAPQERFFETWRGGVEVLRTEVDADYFAASVKAEAGK